MSEGGLEVVIHRKLFYRDSFRRLVFVFFLLLITNIAALTFIYYLYTIKPKDQFFATNSAGCIISDENLAVEGSNYSKSQIRQWAMNAIMTGYSMNYLNYNAVQAKFSGLFTSVGWKKYVESFKDSTVLQEMVDFKAIVVVHPTAAPTIRRQMRLNTQYGPRYAWEVKVPVQLDYHYSNGQIKSYPHLYTVQIFRVPRTTSPFGIAIENIIG